MLDQPNLVVLPDVITNDLKDLNICTHKVEHMEGVAFEWIDLGSCAEIYRHLHFGSLALPRVLGAWETPDCPTIWYPNGVRFGQRMLVRLLTR